MQYLIFIFSNDIKSDCQIAGELIGQKVVINEFVAYLGLLDALSDISKRSEIILIYALCGFSNFGAIGITLGLLLYYVTTHSPWYFNFV